MLTDLPDPAYAKTSDGTYIAYQIVGEGDIDLAWQLDFYGDLDAEWESPLSQAWFGGLAAFTRLILHDRRATGLSSRNVAPPNLETRVSDLLTVLDAARSERPVLAGVGEGGAVAALFAATHPSRSRGLVWWEPKPRTLWAPDYPWGSTPAQVEEEDRALQDWGTDRYARSWALHIEEEFGAPPPEDEKRGIAKQSRQTCTPDVAVELTRIWNETDIRGVLHSVQTPTLLMTQEDEPRQIEVARHVASFLRDVELAILPTAFIGVFWERPYLERVRRFIGIESEPVSLDTVLSTVLFTDIVESTAKQSSLGDHDWKALVQRHHAIVREALLRYRGVENDNSGDGFFATFDGPARAIHCALEIVERVRDLGIEVRAGVHTGECELIDNKVGGLAVTIGARSSAIAGSSQVLVTQTVKDLVAGSGLTFEGVGEHELKGVPDRWHLYRVLD